jgi:hypothetical protein
MYRKLSLLGLTLLAACGSSSDSDSDVIAHGTVTLVYDGALDLDTGDTLAASALSDLAFRGVDRALHPINLAAMVEFGTERPSHADCDARDTGNILVYADSLTTGTYYCLDTPVVNHAWFRLAQAPDTSVHSIRVQFEAWTPGD